MHMEAIFDARTRTLLLFVWMCLLWLLEQKLPLARSNQRKALPNLLLMLLVLVMNFFFASLMVVSSRWTSDHRFGLFPWLGADPWVTLIGGIILLDFWAAYLVHVLFHKFQWLWQLHSVHHSDTMVDVTTAFRQHPGESLLRILFTVIGMFLLGLPFWVVVAYQTVSSLYAQMEHSNINLKVHPLLGNVLQRIFVTPHNHKIHHSKLQCETDSNYGNIFVLWDRLFATYNRRTSYHDIDYGLDYLKEAEKFTFRDLLKLPYRRKDKDR